ncbi:MAG: DMT family transporter [Actinomycetota bacterium]|nr:DMT family transporter [Actinomycetota bacterium]
MTGPTASQPWLAVLAALAGAAVTALGTAAQQRATQRVPGGHGLHLRLIVALARNRLWLASLIGILLGFGLYLLALAHGALVLVQPIMISGLVFGSLFAAWMASRRLDHRLLVGGALCAIGLGSFLTVAQPGMGHQGIRPVGPVLQLLTVLAALLLVGAITASRTNGLPSALALATMTGILFGVNAALTKLVAEQLTRGWSEPLLHWPMYAALVTGPTGFVLSQRAFQLGRLLAPVNAVISTVDPLTAVMIGVVAFGEHIVTTPAALVAELLAVAGLVAGIVIVSRRAARLIAADEAALATGGIGVSTWG